ncbi:MAG: hypothetical protein IPJ49_27520 [Candidatus Obscuribacter sp.]|nr:hypothetical protein [Candidatus Obscuribacter sp.]
MQELPSIDEVGAITPHLGQALLTASLAADHFATAQANIPDPTIIFCANQSEGNTSAVWQEIEKDPEITSRELSTAKALFEIFKAGSIALTNAFQSMDQTEHAGKTPPSLKMRAAYILLKYNLIEAL